MMREVGRIGDALEVRQRHLRRLTHRERRRREHQQRGGAAVGRHARDPRRLDAAVGPDAVDDGETLADLVLRDGEHAPLLIEAAGGDLGRMGVDGDGGEALHRGDVAQMAAEALLVDREIVVERQQHGRDDAVRDVVGMTGHLGLLGRRLRGCARVSNVAIYTTGDEAHSPAPKSSTCPAQRCGVGIAGGKPIVRIGSARWLQPSKGWHTVLPAGARRSAMNPMTNRVSSGRRRLVR